MSNKPGVVLDRRLFRHVANRHSPENPERLRSLYRILESETQRNRFEHIEARSADLAAVQAVHSRFYLDQIEEYARSTDPFAYDRDTYVMPATLDCALLAAGSCLELARAVMNADVNSGFALIRPPGHHAEPGRGMGFCVLNNVAITAAWLRQTYGLSRIMVIDFDVHHGNGNQEAFYNSNEVLVFSIHQNDLFPFSGSASDLGEETGLGYTVNVPVFAQYGDVEYTYLAGRILQALAEQYLPQIILVSAGFDGHVDDPISKTCLSTGWFATVTRLVRQLAATYCDGRLLMILEGGYNPASLEPSVLAVLEALGETNPRRVGILPSERAARLISDHPARQFWTF
ncbi:histone deacetylase [Desulfosarcina ovata]|uniref:Histone deacetylase n=1 Tax=Desulfosarcina ovata subsp. ovata TaxID=2752305 RepID=A0A5K8AAX9_9BACT|nr:histone deacetylase [Desulfosarcina ovata]BBO89194.1 histone deacetylase [Desulfosarcina ovata subsp. ovata]